MHACTLRIRLNFFVITKDFRGCSTARESANARVVAVLFACGVPRHFLPSRDVVSLFLPRVVFEERFLAKRSYYGWKVCVEPRIGRKENRVAQVNFERTAEEQRTRQ